MGTEITPKRPTSHLQGGSSPRPAAGVRDELSGATRAYCLSGLSDPQMGCSAKGLKYHSLGNGPELRLVGKD